MVAELEKVELVIAAQGMVIPDLVSLILEIPPKVKFEPCRPGCKYVVNVASGILFNFQ